jgi:hypothetical protein
VAERLPVSDDSTYAMLRAILAATAEQERTFDAAMQNLAAAVRGLQTLIETGFEKVLAAMDSNGEEN